MWIVRYKALRAQLQKIHHEKKFGNWWGGGCKISDPSHVFVVFPLLGISGSDFSTLDIVSVLASLLFMVEAEKKKEVFTQTRRERNFLFQKGGEAREGERHSLWAVAAAVAAVRRRRAETATPFAGDIHFLFISYSASFNSIQFTSVLWLVGNFSYLFGEQLKLVI